MGRPIDRNAVDRLVVEHLPMAMRFALRLTAGAPELAEELVQEALCRVLRRWRSYRGEGSFRTWMLQILVNVDRDRRRQRKPLPLPVEEAPCPAAAPPEQAAVGELRERILAAIHCLPERQREVALLSLGEGLPAHEVARVLGISAGNVHVCLHLARKRIAQAIGIDYPQPSRSE